MYASEDTVLIVVLGSPITGIVASEHQPSGGVHNLSVRGPDPKKMNGNLKRRTVRTLINKFLHLITARITV